MRKELEHVLLVCLVFTALFLAVPGSWHSGGDYQTHFLSARYPSCQYKSWYSSEDMPPKHVLNCESQPILFKWVAGFFTFQEQTFWGFSVIILTILTPLALFFLTRNLVTVWFYFSVSGYLYFLINGLQSQAFTGLFFILLLGFRNIFARLGLLMVLLLSHSQGFNLGVLTLLVVLFFENVKTFKNAFLSGGCSTVFGENRPEILNEGIDISPITENSPLYSLTSRFTVAHFLVLFVKIVPLPFFLMSLKHLFESKKWDFLVLIALFLGLGLIVHDRVWYFLTPFYLVGLTGFYETLSRARKKWLLVGCVPFLAFNLWSFANFHLVC